MINELLSFIIIYKVYSTIIKLNFYKLNQTYSNNESINFELLHKSNILTNITIGTPPKTIKAYIQFKYFEYYIIDNKTNPDFYSKDSSSTFFPKPKEPIEFIDSPFLYGYYTTETFIFNNILNQEEKIENLPTIIGIDLNIKFRNIRDIETLHDAICFGIILYANYEFPAFFHYMSYVIV